MLNMPLFYYSFCKVSYLKADFENVGYASRKLNVLLKSSINLTGRLHAIKSKIVCSFSRRSKNYSSNVSKDNNSYKDRIEKIYVYFPLLFGSSELVHASAMKTKFQIKLCLTTVLIK
jgi:hypothetical protein